MLHGTVTCCTGVPSQCRLNFYCVSVGECAEQKLWPSCSLVKRGKGMMNTLR